jgi:hypothetical protein
MQEEDLKPFVYRSRGLELHHHGSFMVALVTKIAGCWIFHGEW